MDVGRGRSLLSGPSFAQVAWTFHRLHVGLLNVPEGDHRALTVARLFPANPAAAAGRRVRDGGLFIGGFWRRVIAGGAPTLGDARRSVSLLEAIANGVRRRRLAAWAVLKQAVGCGGFGAALAGRLARQLRQELRRAVRNQAARTDPFHFVSKRRFPFILIGAGPHSDEHVQDFPRLGHDLDWKDRARRSDGAMETETIEALLSLVGSVSVGPAGGGRQFISVTDFLLLPRASAC